MPELGPFDGPGTLIATTPERVPPRGTPPSPTSPAPHTVELDPAAMPAAAQVLDLVAELYGANEADAYRLVAFLADVYAPPAPEDPERRFAPAERPYVRDGIIVPATSVEADRLAPYQYVPVRTVQSLGTTRRAILAYGRGRPLVLWVGDDEAERDAALDELLAAMGRAR